MRNLAIIFVCFALCSCASHSTFDVTGNDPAWISQDDSIQLAIDLLTRKGYPSTQCVSAEIAGKDCKFIFDTSDPALRVLVHVDRKTMRANIVQWIHLDAIDRLMIRRDQHAQTFMFEPIKLPRTATPEQCISTLSNRGELHVRKIQEIRSAHSHDGNFTAVLLDSDAGQKIVLLQPVDANDWFFQIYDAE